MEVIFEISAVEARMSTCTCLVMLVAVSPSGSWMKAMFVARMTAVSLLRIVTVTFA